MPHYNSFLLLILHLLHKFECLMLLIWNYMNMDSGRIRLIFCFLVLDRVLTCILIPAASVEGEQFPIFLVTLRRPQAWVPPFVEM